MHILCSNNIYYSNKEHLPLGEVAKSLLALEKAISMVPQALENMYGDVVAQDIEVYLEELHEGSLSERLRYYIRLAIQKQVEDESGLSLGNIDGIPNERQEKIAAWLIVACLLVALKYGANQVWPDTPKPNIEHQINVTLNAGRDITGLEPAQLANAIESSIKDNPDAVKGALAFVKPAKKDAFASIAIDGEQVLTPQTLAELPAATIESEQVEKSLEFEDVEIRIRATDRDSGKRGWAATIPEFMDRRIRVHVSPNIDLNFLAQHDQVVGNVSVFYSLDERGNIIKPHAHLFSIDRVKTAKLPKRRGKAP
jgi:hypothetical protein